MVKTNYKIGSKKTINRAISTKLDKSIKQLQKEAELKHPKEKDKISYIWVTNNIEVKWKK